MNGWNKEGGAEGAECFIQDSHEQYLGYLMTLDGEVQNAFQSR